jgi:hypothetical protein
MWASCDGATKPLCTSDPHQSLGRTIEPGHHAGQGPDGQGDCDQRHGEADPEVRHKAVEGLHHAGGELLTTRTMLASPLHAGRM